MIKTSFKKIFQEKDYIIMGGNNKEALQRENTIRFIEAAEELIDEHGVRLPRKPAFIIPLFISILKM